MNQLIFQSHNRWQSCYASLITKMCSLFFFALETVERATAEVLFQAIDKHFQLPLTLSYSNLVGLGTDGANVMLGRRNSVFSRLQTEQPSLIAIHCNCHI